MDNPEYSKLFGECLAWPYINGNMDPVQCIDQVKSKYNNIKISLSGSICTMLFGQFGRSFCSEQSAIDLNDTNRHVFDYSLLSMHSLLFCPAPSNILVVGLGGGVIPSFFNKHVPNAQIDIFEIDEEVLNLAKKHFKFEENENKHVIIGDAFNSIQQAEKKYDIVIVDAYNHDYIPYHIMSKEFHSMIFKSLSENGVMAVNISNIHPSFYSQINTIRNVFGDIIYRLDGRNNPYASMLFVLKKDTNINKDIHPFLEMVPYKIKINKDIVEAKIFSIRNV